MVKINKINLLSYAQNSSTPPLPTNGLAANLAAYWKFDENSDGSQAVDRIDATANGHNFIKVFDNVPSALGLDNRQAVDLSNNKGFTTSHHADFTVGQNFSFSLWYQPHSFNTYDYLFSKYIPSAREYVLQINSSQVQLLLGEGNSNFIDTFSSGFNLQVNSWHHIVLAHDRDNQNLIFYVNNVKAIEPYYGTTGTLGTGVLAINGLSNNAGVTANGLMQDVGFWSNRVLSDADVATLYNSGTPFSFDNFN